VRENVERALLICACLFLKIQSEFSLCRLYTKSGYPRQFDRRPRAAAAASGGSESPAAPSLSTAALLANVEETGRKKKRSAQNNDTSSSDDVDGGRVHSKQQRQLAPEASTEEGLVNATDDWTEFLGWF
jgi:hypothetical protein